MKSRRGRRKIIGRQGVCTMWIKRLVVRIRCKFRVLQKLRKIEIQKRWKKYIFFVGEEKLTDGAFNLRIIEEDMTQLTGRESP